MELFESDAWKQLAVSEEEKRKSLKFGVDVMHLKYFLGSITQEDLLQYEHELNKVGLKLSSYDKHGQVTNSLDELTLLTFLALSNTTIKTILDGTLTNITWETVKHISVSIWRKVRGQKYTKVTSDKSEKKSISFGLVVRLDKNTTYNFELNGNMSEETVLQSLDKILGFLKEQTPNTQYKFPYFTTYNPETEAWEAIDIEEEIKKKIVENQNNE